MRIRPRRLHIIDLERYIGRCEGGLDGTEIYAEDGTLRMVVAEIYSPDSGPGADVEDAVEDFVLWDWGCEEFAVEDELEFVVLEVETVGFHFVVWEGVGPVLGV